MDSFKTEGEKDFINVSALMLSRENKNVTTFWPFNLMA